MCSCSICSFPTHIWCPPLDPALKTWWQHQSQPSVHFTTIQSSLSSADTTGRPVRLDMKAVRHSAHMRVVLWALRMVSSQLINLWIHFLFSTFSLCWTQCEPVSRCDMWQQWQELTNHSPSQGSANNQQALCWQHCWTYSSQMSAAIMNREEQYMPGTFQMSRGC